MKKMHKSLGQSTNSLGDSDSHSKSGMNRASSEPEKNQLQSSKTATPEESGQGSQDVSTSSSGRKLACDSNGSTIESQYIIGNSGPQQYLHLSQTASDHDNEVNNNDNGGVGTKGTKVYRNIKCRNLYDANTKHGETDCDHCGGLETTDTKYGDCDYDKDRCTITDGIVISDEFHHVTDSVHLAHSSSISLTAAQSMSPLRVDSGDKSLPTTIMYRSSHKSASLRSRKRTMITTKDKLVRGSDKGDSGSERDSCTCVGVQDQKYINDGDSSKLFSQSDEIGKSLVNKNKFCRCQLDSQKHYLNQNSCSFIRVRRGITTAKCSEFERWSDILLSIASLLKRFLTFSWCHSSEASTTTSQLKGRRRTRSKSSIKLRRCYSTSRLPIKGFGNKSLKYIAWQKQQAGTVIGANQKCETMPTKNYGSVARYQSLTSTTGLRRSSNSRRLHRHRDLPRNYDSDGYLRLGNNYYQKAPQPSLIQELKRLLLLLLIVAICGVVLWQIYEILIEETNFLGTVKFSPSVLGTYKYYAVSTDAEPCAKIGKSLLAKGGHAVDAAIGTLICMGIALPNSLGLGGGCLMTVYDNVTKTATVIDGRETAPDYATENMFASNPLAASRGPLSIGVPGELAAYWEAHQRFGRLPWAMLFEDSIKMAEEGFRTVEHLSAACRDMSHAKHMSPELRAMLTNNATGDYYREGEIMYAHQIAKTLRRVRDNGVSEFYGGTTGQLFIEDLHKQGGKMTLENLRNYKALVKAATVIGLDNDVTVYTQPIPGSGVVLSIILRIMKELGYYKNFAPRINFEASALYYHHLSEAFKFAYAQRAALEDQPDDPIRLEKLIANITSDNFIKSAVSKINNLRTQPSHVYGGLENFQEDHGTAHTSVIDSEGNSVAITTSVNLYFGSGLVSPRTGIIYNDVMDDFTSPNLTNKFSLPPSKYNHIRPGKRPISSMAPSIFVDSHGNPKLIIGASGGSKITTAIATVALRNLFFDEDLKTAIDGPRIHHQFLPDKLMFEANFEPEILASLKNRGHGLQVITGRSSVVMAIACNYTESGLKTITANSDYRKGGSVGGL